MRHPRLEHVRQDDSGAHTYLDLRKPILKKKGYGGAFPKRRLRKDIILFFHPFRFYVLYHINRAFEMKTSPTQFLFYPNGYFTIVDAEVRRLDRWTSAQKFIDILDKWNLTAEAAIVFDPISYSIVFSRGRLRLPDASKLKTSQYLSKVKSLIDSDDTARMEEFRMDLCTNAEVLNDNKILHVLVRLTTWHDRHHVKSALGGCMLLLSMAEVIRRGMEEALGKKLPEEDELGFGQWMPGARRQLYGSDRALDAPQTALRTFLSEAGIDYGPRCDVILRAIPNTAR